MRQEAYDHDDLDEEEEEEEEEERDEEEEENRGEEREDVRLRYLRTIGTHTFKSAIIRSKFLCVFTSPSPKQKRMPRVNEHERFGSLLYTHRRLQKLYNF